MSAVSRARSFSDRVSDVVPRLLTADFLAPYYAKGDPFKTLLARSIYLTHYCRNAESWTDTIRRVVEGNCALDPNVEPQEARQLFHLYWTMQALPPGRGLWTGGVPGIPASARFNCHATELRSLEDWCWTADQLMCGGGVGVSLTTIDRLPVVAAGPAMLSVRCRPDHPDVGEVKPGVVEDIHIANVGLSGIRFVVPDSREGWVDALRMVLKCAYTRIDLVVDVSKVRARGAPIVAFGGTSCGPGPLAELLRNVWRVVRGAHGRRLNSVECLDITNFVGYCIKSGNVRRSALIVLGEPGDSAFRSAKKDYEAVKNHRHTSNNSIVFRTDDEVRNFDWTSLVDDLAEFGEPGIVNLALARKTDPGAVVCNPCSPDWATVLTPKGIRTFADIDVGSTIWSGQCWTKVVRKVATGVKPVFAYKTRAGTFLGTENHRVVQNGEKIEVQYADSIDRSIGPAASNTENIDPQDVLDGLMLGDGTCTNGKRNMLVVGAKDRCYFNSEVAHLITPATKGYQKQGHTLCEAVTTFTERLPLTYNRTVPDRFRLGEQRRARGFLRGLYSANGTVLASEKARGRITLKATSFEVIEVVQEMLSSLGIQSYYTINKARDVDFSNGTYTCRQSYDLSISQSRRLFRKLIGFLQPEKQAKLDAACALEEATIHNKAPKSSYDIMERESLGEHLVYDITVDAPEHTYWTGGLLVSNCSEIFLHNHESCNLAEVFPGQFDGATHAPSVFKLVTRYCLRQRLCDLPDPEADFISKQNMRLGVGIGGACDFDWTGPQLREWFLECRKEADHYADELEVNHPIAVTTVKPSGSISLLNGSSPGMHAPFAPYYIRRTRIAKNDPMAGAMIEAGVPHEDCIYDRSGNTWVFSFPMAAPHDKVAGQTEGIRSQFERQLALQQYWSDNAVSATLNFNADEREELAACLSDYVPHLKSTSCLPRAHGYDQPPYSSVDKHTFEEAYAKIDHSHPLVLGGDIEIDECAGGVCPVK